MESSRWEKFSVGCIFLFLISWMPHAHAQSLHPDSARIVTDDIVHFWEAWDQADSSFDAHVFETHYIAQGSVGLHGFMRGRIQDAENLASVVRSHPRFYASIRPQTQRVVEAEQAIRASFYAMKYLYPEALFPEVYFVIGALNSGGTSSSQALIIGAEMYGRTPDMPTEELNDWQKQVIGTVENVPHIVAHELVHFQQRQRTSTLLEQSLKEGSADFVAELISGRHINQHVHAYANPREDALWEEFQAIMHESEYAGWLYGGDREEGRPADLGYWMGYKITASYYDHAADKRQALADILEMQDAKAFLKASQYPTKFAR